MLLPLQVLLYLLVAVVLFVHVNSARTSSFSSSIGTRSSDGSNKQRNGQINNNNQYSNTVSSKFIGNRFADVTKFTYSDSGSSDNSVIPKPCINSSLDLGHDSNGRVSILQTFFQCLINQPDAQLCPYYYAAQQLQVGTKVILNNFISIVEIDNSVQFDFFVIYAWTDARLSMPPLWDAIDPAFSVNGVDITNAVLLQDVKQAQFTFWMPDIFFPEAKTYELVDQSIVLYPNGTIVWTNHVYVTLLVSTLQYHEYPDDYQSIEMRYFSFAMSETELEMHVTGVDFVSYNNSGKPAFGTNSIWSLVSATSDVTSEFVGDASSFGFKRSVVAIAITMKRIPDGIVTRLAFPILLLLFLAAFTFWAIPQTRVDFTVTILLALSALSIVSYDHIPMIGYLTKIDRYMTYMFVTLFVCNAAHQFIERLLIGGDNEWPLRKVYIRMIEATGRVVLIPFIFVLYFTSFTSVYKLVRIYTALAAVFAFTIAVLTMEVNAIVRHFKHAVKQIASKIEKLESTSTFERLVFNLYTFKKFSDSLSYAVRNKAITDKQKEIDRRQNDIRRAELSIKGLANDSSNDDVNHDNDIELTEANNDDHTVYNEFHPASGSGFDM